MAWNEPGNSPGKRNPWEKRPGKPVPAGLDEIIKQIKKKFAAAPGGAGVSIGVMLLVVLGLLWAVTGMYQVDAGQVAVVTRFGKFQRVEQPGRGIRLPWPIEEAVLVNMLEEQNNAQLRVLTSDEAFVDVVFTLKWHRADAVAWAFNVRDPQSAFSELTESVMREVLGQQTLNTVLIPTRQTLATHARDLLQAALDASKTGLVLNGIDIIDVRVPSEVKSAQEELSKAQLDRNAAVAQANEYESNLKPTVAGDAAVIREKAIAYKSQRIADATGDTEQFLKLLPEYQKAPAATRERLYIETMQSIYARSRKVFVDSKGNTINLAVDKFVNPASGDTVVDTKPTTTSTPTPTKGSH